MTEKILITCLVEPEFKDAFARMATSKGNSVSHEMREALKQRMDESDGHKETR